MYPPSQHLTHNRELCSEVIRAYPLATVVTVDSNGQPQISYAPMVLRQTAEGWELHGHLDSRNPQAKGLSGNMNLIFQGPNTYISPQVYGNLNRLPTWNYVIVEVKGDVRRLSEEEALNSILHLSKAMEGAKGQPLEGSDERMPPLLPYITGFACSMEQVIGRFKLSQDKPEPEKQGALEAMIEQSAKVDRNLLQRILSEK